MHATLQRHMGRYERTPAQGNAGFMIPATSNSGSGMGADAFPDTTGEIQGIHGVAGGVIGLPDTGPTTNPGTSSGFPNNTTGYVPPPKRSRNGTLNYGLSMTPGGNIWPNGRKGWSTVTENGGMLRGIRTSSTYPRYRFTDDGGGAGGQGAGAASSGATKLPGQLQPNGRPQSNFNPYARDARLLNYGDGTGSYWSWDIAGDAANMQAAFGSQKATSPDHAFNRQLHYSGSTVAAVGVVATVAGALVLGPFIWTALGRGIVKKRAASAYSKAHAHIVRHA